METLRRHGFLSLRSSDNERALTRVSLWLSSAMSRARMSMDEKLIKTSEAFRAHRDGILRLAFSHGVENPRVFGSTARGEDVEGSDLDILVDARRGTTLFDLGAPYEHLRATLGIRVDLVTGRELPADIRAQVQQEARPI